MLQHPQFDPVAFSIDAFEVFGFTLGPIEVHWYGITYLVAFAVAWRMAIYRARKPELNDWDPEAVSDFIFYAMLGVILGGRLGYVFFYGREWLVQDWHMIYRVWEGGMSFHGGLMGMIIACFYFAWRTNRNFLDVTDFVGPMTPLGLGMGRIANFINGELWGRTTDVPWGMVFAGGGPDPRHPSQLYQFAIEGVIVFGILWWFTSKPRPRCASSGMFMILYGTGRFMVEFFREPDAHMGFVAFQWMSMGQLLCLPMLLLGVVLLWIAYRTDQPAGGKPELKKAS